MKEKKCRAKNPANCRHHGSMTTMDTNKVVANEEYANLMSSGNIMSIPNLTPEDRVFLSSELTRISNLSNGYHYDYDSAPRPSSREGEEAFLDAYDPTKYGLSADAVVNTSDNIVFTRGDDNRLKVLLIQRKAHPYKGYWCTPGGFVDAGESALDAASRELQEETNMTLPEGSLQSVKKYDHPWRDGRMKHLQANSHVAFIPSIPKFEAGDDAADAKLVDVGQIFVKNSPISLGFDHKQEIADSIRHLMN
jgi:8-oxo-dGTP diphosphatase